MKLAKHEYLAESALNRLDEKEHNKHLEEIDKLRKEALLTTKESQ